MNIKVALPNEQRHRVKELKDCVYTPLTFFCQDMTIKPPQTDDIIQNPLCLIKDFFILRNTIPDQANDSAAIDENNFPHNILTQNSALTTARKQMRLTYI